MQLALLVGLLVRSGERTGKIRADSAQHHHLAVGCSVMLHALLSIAGVFRGAVFVLMASGMAHAMYVKVQWSLQLARGLGTDDCVVYGMIRVISDSILFCMRCCARV